MFKCLIYKQTNKTEDIKYLKLNKTHNQAHQDELGAGVYILYQNHSSDYRDSEEYIPMIS